MKKLIIPAVLLMTTSVFAQGVANLDFAGVDTDKDGAISMSELQVALPGYDEERFKTLDVDGNGSLSEEEYSKIAAEQSDSTFTPETENPDDSTSQPAN